MDQTKGNPGNPKVENPKTPQGGTAVAATTIVLAPKDLAVRLGISPKRLRAMMRAGYARAPELKGKKWEIDKALAKKVEEEYKAKKAKAEAEKQAEIKKELAGTAGATK